MGIARSKPQDGVTDDKKSARRPSSETRLVPATLHFEIQSDHALQRDVQTAILNEVEKRGFAGQAVFAIKLALEEALINAIKHGNRLDRSKKVIVDAKISSSTAEISIEDQGPGFDRSSVPDPLDDENLEKCSGRGILLMESYMTSVSWSRDGRRVKLVKKNQSPTTKPSSKAG